MKFIFSVLFIASLSFADIVYRGAFDVGSGSTKLKVAKVDTEKQKVLEVIFPKGEKQGSYKVSYKAALEGNAEGEIPMNTLLKGALTILKLKEEASEVARENKIDPKEIVYSGVATGAFREAKNANAALKKLSSESRIPITLISQEEEAKLGFLSGSQGIDASPAKLIVWDIGGATMQLTTYSEDNKFQFYGSNLASETFKKLLIENFNKKGNSPNPISEEEMKFGLEHIKKNISLIPADLQKKLKDPTISIVGVGGVHFFSVKKQILNEKEDTFTPRQIRDSLGKLLGLSDEKIGGNFAETQVSNLILVLGYMEALEIQKVRVVEASLSDAVLMVPKYWKLH